MKRILGAGRQRQPCFHRRRRPVEELFRHVTSLNRLGKFVADLRFREQNLNIHPSPDYNQTRIKATYMVRAASAFNRSAFHRSAFRSPLRALIALTAIPAIGLAITISGKVLDENGAPVQGVRVSVGSASA